MSQSIFLGFKAPLISYSAVLILSKLLRGQGPRKIFDTNITYLMVRYIPVDLLGLGTMFCR